MKAKSNISCRAIGARDQVISPLYIYCTSTAVTRGALYVTPDHLHRNPTKYCVTGIFASANSSVIYSLYLGSIFARGINHASREIDALLLRSRKSFPEIPRLCLARGLFFFINRIITDCARLTCKNFQKKSEEAMSFDLGMSVARYRVTPIIL